MMVKICGITSLEDALAAIAAGANMLGFNFYLPSPRYLSRRDCAAIVSGLAETAPRRPPSPVTLIGVFVNTPPVEIAAILDDCGLHYAQLSGDEPPEWVEALTGRAFKAIRPPNPAAALQQAARYAIHNPQSKIQNPMLPSLLVDASHPGLYGGSGKTGDWQTAREIAARYPILLAGGLNPKNVAAAIAQVHPWGVDVASGVETAPGKKDPLEMAAFVTAARGSRQSAVGSRQSAVGSRQSAVGSRQSAVGSRQSSAIGEKFMSPFPHPPSAIQNPKSKISNLPSKFGPYGGQFVPETLMPALAELELAYQAAHEDADFQREFSGLLQTYVGRPTPLSHARRLSEHLGGAQILLKREDLAHSGAHKINNALGQALLAMRMGKRRLIAETGAGQHGVAAATAAALLGLDCVIYMGTIDIARQQPNVLRMKLLGAEVRPVESGSRTLKDAINEAIRDWVTNVRGTHYLLGSALGPHPYPTMVRDFQSVIGHEARAQMLTQVGKLPELCIACVGGGSNSIGLFHAFREDAEVALVGVEAGGEGIASGKHAARFSDPQIGRPGVLHGAYTYVLQDADGQIAATHSISAGLDYPAVGPEHAHLRELGRVEYTYATDEQALQGFQMLARYEGILPALESAHAVAEALQRAPRLNSDQTILINLSGRGDKDLDTVMKALH